MAEFNKFDWYRSLAGADITDSEFRVLVLLANYADGQTGKRAFPSAPKLAIETGKSVSTVRRALKALVSKGWLAKIDRPGTSAEYRLTTPTLVTQMTRVTEPDPAHPDDQGPEQTLVTQMTTPPCHLDDYPPSHPDDHRSDQLPEPDNRSGSRSDQETPTGSLAVAVETAAEDDPFASPPMWLAHSRQHEEPAAGYPEPAIAIGAPLGDPFS